MNTVPKFGKVELLLYSDLKDKTLTTNITHEDCGFIITGDYIIIVIDERNDINNSNTSTGMIYHLSEVKAYKTHAQ
jgi:hypothetical protein